MCEKKNAFELLSPFMEDERRNRLTQVLEKRTKGVVLVLENLYNTHNLSAILRSAESFGLQYVYLSGQYPEEINPTITVGSEFWVTLKKERDFDKLIKKLKKEDYLIGATVPSKEGIDPYEYKGEKPIALLFGNERQGLTKQAIKRADIIFSIPHYGFTKSLNVSVSAGIFLYSLMKNQNLRNFPLSQKEKKELLDLWAKRSVPNSQNILKEVKKRGGII